MDGTVEIFRTDYWNSDDASRAVVTGLAYDVDMARYGALRTENQGGNRGFGAFGAFALLGSVL